MRRRGREGVATTRVLINTAAQVKCSGKTSNDPCDNCARLKLDCSFTQSLNGSQPLGMRYMPSRGTSLHAQLTGEVVQTRLSGSHRTAPSLKPAPYGSARREVSSPNPRRDIMVDSEPFAYQDPSVPAVPYAQNEMQR
jgi:hypothetical protein